MNDAKESKGDKLSTFEVAKRLNKSYIYVLRRVKLGKIPSEYVNGEYLVRLEDAERYFSTEHKEKKGRDMDGYLSAATVAQKYGVSYKSLRKRLRKGDIPSTKRNGYYYISPEDAKKFFGNSGEASD